MNGGRRISIMPQGLFAKLLSSYLAIIIVTLLVLASLFSFLFQSFYIKIQKEKFVSQGQEIAKLVSASLETGSQEYLTSLLSVIDRFVEGQVWVSDRTGLVLASSPHGGEGLRLTSDDVRQVLTGEVVTRSGWVKEFGEPMLFVAVPIKVEKKSIGAVLIYSPLSGINDTISRVRKLTLYAAIFSIGLSILIGLKLSRSLSKPLLEMSKIAGDMAKGNFHQRVRVRVGGEVGELGSAFNNLALELERTVNSLQTEKSRTESILLSMAEGVIAVDAAGQVMTMNPSAKEMFGDELTPEVKDMFRKVLDSGEAAVSEMTAPSGSVMLAHFSPLKDEYGLVDGAVGVLQDISQRWRLEQLQREFVANVSHELRTPLTSIQGFAEALADGVISSPDDMHRFSLIIVDEAKRLGRLVGDLLDLARMEGGSFKLDLAPTRLGNVVERVVHKVCRQAQEAGLELFSATFTDDDVVLAEEDRVEQVLINLISNAVQHSPKGSRIGIELRDSGDFIACDVVDEGEGIPPEEQERIWNRFVRTEESRTRAKGGTGLGLAIVKQIVELHGGQISLESKPNEGSRFTFTLPKMPRPLA